MQDFESSSDESLSTQSELEDDDLSIFPYTIQRFKSCSTQSEFLNERLSGFSCRRRLFESSSESLPPSSDSSSQSELEDNRLPYLACIMQHCRSSSSDSSSQSELEDEDEDLSVFPFMPQRYISSASSDSSDESSSMDFPCGPTPPPLPKDLLMLIMLEMPPLRLAFFINCLAKSNGVINSVLLHDDFWKKKLEMDYSVASDIVLTSYRDLYHIIFDSKGHVEEALKYISTEEWNCSQIMMLLKSGTFSDLPLLQTAIKIDEVDVVALAVQREKVNICSLIDAAIQDHSPRCLKFLWSVAPRDPEAVLMRQVYVPRQLADLEDQFDLLEIILKNSSTDWILNQFLQALIFHQDIGLIDYVLDHLYNLDPSYLRNLLAVEEALSTHHRVVLKILEDPRVAFDEGSGMISSSDDYRATGFMTKILHVAADKTRSYQDQLKILEKLAAFKYLEVEDRHILKNPRFVKAYLTSDDVMEELFKESDIPYRAGVSHAAHSVFYIGEIGGFEKAVLKSLLPRNDYKRFMGY
ncbi:Hypothetical protein POVR1_LOCUS148 [uncultured virus]|nr:Hypothetical protein POVR1_LOCUS148 [uncultured virus]